MYLIRKTTRSESQYSALSIRCERFDKSYKRLLKSGVVVLQHAIAAATRQIALEAIVNLFPLARNNKRTSVLSPLPVVLPTFTAPSTMLYACSSCLAADN